jgi:hypothetical protein
MIKLFRKFILKVFDKLLEFIGLAFKAKPVDPNFELFIVALFQNEADILTHWIDFHIEQGFDKIFLINNYSTDDSLEVIKNHRYAANIVVVDSVFRKMNGFKQAIEYNNVNRLIRESNKYSFVAFIDIDEFIFCTNGLSLKSNLKELMYQKLGAVLVNWFMFGTSGLKLHNTDEPIYLQNIYRATDSHNAHFVYKSIVYMPNLFAFFGGPHKPKIKGKALFTFSDGKLFDTNVNYFCKNPIRINHYWYRSEDYYNNVKKGRRKDFVGEIRLADFENRHKQLCNSIKDETIKMVVSENY